jgi:DNA polymerase I-like protein with 3'-5' exonuclease and polymerase domains
VPKNQKNADFWKSVVNLLYLDWVDTQKKREKIIKTLEKMLKKAYEEGDAKTCAYISQVLNKVLDSMDQVRFNEDIQRLKRMMEDVKKRLGQAREGTPVA